MYVYVYIYIFTYIYMLYKYPNGTTPIQQPFGRVLIGISGPAWVKPRRRKKSTTASPSALRRPQRLHRGKMVDST